MTGAGRRPAELRSGRPGVALRADPAAPRFLADALPDLRRARTVRSFVAAVVVVALAAVGCTPSSTPIPSPSASPTPAPTIVADGVPTLRFAISGDPSGLLPPARDPDTRRIQAFLYDSLYRLDDALRPVPVLAADVPKVSKDGKTWTIPIRSGLTFSDDSALDAGDVAATLRLARSLSCPFGDACRIAADHLLDVQVKGDAVVLTLDRPWAPLLATFLADLPILPSDGLQASLDRLVAGAKAVDRKALAESIGRISDEVNAEACDGDAPPATCEPAEHVDELASWLTKAAVTAPLPERFADESGTVDGDAYGIALLAAVDALADVLGRPGAGATPRPSGGAVDAKVDRMAKALPLLDLGRAPVGTGPYRLVSYVPGGSVVLERRGLAPAGAPRRVQAVILRDAVEAATALQSGQIDWLPTVAPEVVPVLESDPTLVVAGRPSGAVRTIVFNVRDGHPYADPSARQAFSRCLDRDTLVADILAGRGLPASTLVAPGSWAARPSRHRAADPAAAKALLETAGYVLGSDDIYARDGERLSSEIIIRPGRAELAALMDAISKALRACGIDLRIREVPFSPDVVLPQLEYPNAFDTYLATVSQGVDPGLDLGWLSSDRVTTKADPGDANYGGWRDKSTDALLTAGAASLTEAKRRSAYTDLQGRLSDQVPVWPLAYEAAYGAVSKDLLGPDGKTVDPSQPDYERDLLEWRLAEP